MVAQDNAGSNPNGDEFHGTEQPVRPPIAPVKLENLPDGLREYPHFVMWHFEHDEEAKDPDKQWRKTPSQVGKLRQGAKSNDPNTWAPYGWTERVYLERSQAAPGFWGLGFMFCKNDDEYMDDLCFVDLDHCYNRETGEVAAWAQEIVDRFNTYTEVSPRGSGLHLYGRGILPGKNFKVGDVEFYDKVRFTTLTGEHLPSTPATINDTQAAVDWLHARLAAECEDTAQPRAGTRTHTPITLSDEQLIAKIRGSKQGPLFHSLYDEGKWDDRYPSQSEAVGALVCTLAWWTACDGERIDRLFRASALFSGKWEHKWDDPRGNTTLGALENASAIELTGDNVYEGPTKSQSSGLGSEFAQQPGKKLLSEAELRNLPPLKPVLGKILYERSVVMLYAPPGRWKSFVMTAWAVAIAAGVDWHGHRVGRQGPVIIIAGEGSGGSYNRIKAAKRQFGITEDLPLYVRLAAVHLLEDEQVAAFVEEVKGELGTEKPVAIFIDTLTRAIVPGDENSAKDVGRLIAAAEWLRDMFDCCVVFIHHTGHDQGHGRGSSALSGNPDSVIKIESVAARAANEKLMPGELVKISNEKPHRDAAPFDDLTVTTQVAAWPDERTESGMASTLAVVPAEPAVSTTTAGGKVKLSTNQHGVLDILLRRNHKKYPKGMSCTEWQNAALPRVGISKRTFMTIHTTLEAVMNFT